MEEMKIMVNETWLKAIQELLDIAIRNTWIRWIEPANKILSCIELIKPEDGQDKQNG